MVANKDFEPLLEPSIHRPWAKSKDGKKSIIPSLDPGLQGILRDQLSITTWLALGATLQTALYTLLGYRAFAPSILLLTFRLLSTYLSTVGYQPNPLMANVVKTKYSAQFPDSVGQFGSKPSNGQIVVLLLGFRINHPLGLLAPGASEIGDFFTNMTAHLREHADDYGYLGGSSWLSTGRESKNEVMSVYHFLDHEGIEKFAHGEYHRKAWAWWNRHVAEMDHMGLWHEIYVAPRGSWENVYMNSEPVSMGAIAFPVEEKEEGGKGKVFVSPIVDARRGLLKTSKGRMAMSGKADEHDKFGDDPYDV